MAAAKKPGFKLSQEQYAFVYNVHPNTIFRWQRQDMPLDDPEELILALCRRRKPIPDGIRRKREDAIIADYRRCARR